MQDKLSFKKFPLLGPFQRSIRYECIYKQYLMPSTYVYQLNFSLYLLLIDIIDSMSYLSIKPLLQLKICLIKTI